MYQLIDGFLDVVGIFFIVYLIGYSTFLFLSVVVVLSNCTGSTASGGCRTTYPMTIICPFRLLYRHGMRR